MFIENSLIGQTIKSIDINNEKNKIKFTFTNGYTLLCKSTTGRWELGLTVPKKKEID